MKSYFIILRHCSMHWPCLPGKWSSHYPTIPVGSKIWRHNRLRKAREHQWKMVICCCWHSSANRRLVHITAVCTHVMLSSVREVPKDFEMDFIVNFEKRLNNLTAVFCSGRLILPEMMDSLFPVLPCTHSIFHNLKFAFFSLHSYPGTHIECLCS